MRVVVAYGGVDMGVHVVACMWCARGVCVWWCACGVRAVVYACGVYVVCVCGGMRVVVCMWVCIWWRVWCVYGVRVVSVRHGRLCVVRLVMQLK